MGRPRAPAGGRQLLDGRAGSEQGLASFSGSPSPLQDLAPLHQPGLLAGGEGGEPIEAFEGAVEVPAPELKIDRRVRQRDHVAETLQAIVEAAQSRLEMSITGGLEGAGAVEEGLMSGPVGEIDRPAVTAGCFELPSELAQGLAEQQQGRSPAIVERGLARQLLEVALEGRFGLPQPIAVEVGLAAQIADLDVRRFEPGGAIEVGEGFRPVEVAAMQVTAAEVELGMVRVLHDPPVEVGDLIVESAVGPGRTGRAERGREPGDDHEQKAADDPGSRPHPAIFAQGLRPGNGVGYHRILLPSGPVGPRSSPSPMTQPIHKIVLREIRLPLREPFQISSGVEDERRILLLELTAADGVTEWSECVASAHPNYSPETIDTCWLAIREWAAPRVLGRRFENAREVGRALEVDFRGHEMAKAALEMGWWGLEALRRGVSLTELLGGSRQRIATGISLGIQASPAALVEKVRDAVAAGYRRAKIKIKPGSDLDCLRSVRDALGPEPDLMADANSAYTLADVDHLAALDDLDLMMIEQPLAWDDLRRHAELQQRLRTPICLDESITGLDRAEDMLALGAGRIVNIKSGRVGGLTAARAIHDLCHDQGIPAWCGGMLESGVGRAYNVALASLPGFTLPGDVSPSARYWERDVVTPEWTMDEEGRVEVPWSKPGIGVEVDRDRVVHLTVRTETVRL